MRLFVNGVDRVMMEVCKVRCKEVEGMEVGKGRCMGCGIHIDEGTIFCSRCAELNEG